MRSSWKRSELRLAISRRGFSTGGFAQVAGVSRETLSRALNGRSTSSETTRRIITTLARLPEFNGADLIEAAK